MILINSSLEVLFMNSINISLLFLLWNLYKKIMEYFNEYYLVYYSIKGSMIFFIFPLSYGIYYIKYCVGEIRGECILK